MDLQNNASREFAVALSEKVIEDIEEDDDEVDFDEEEGIDSEKRRNIENDASELDFSEDFSPIDESSDENLDTNGSDEESNEIYEVESTESSDALFSIKDSTDPERMKSVLDRLTILQLKKVLKENELLVSGKKSELIERLVTHLINK